MEKRNNNTWAMWALGVMGTLLLFVSSLYAASMNGDAVATRQLVAQHSERIAALEETVKQINELKVAMKDLTNAINETNRRNPR